jgi:hypothetical protein
VRQALGPRPGANHGLAQAVGIFDDENTHEKINALLVADRKRRAA